MSTRFIVIFEFLYILYVSVWVGVGYGCRGFGGLLSVRKIPKDEAPLVYKEHVPNTAEKHDAASGPILGKIRPDSNRFHELVYNGNRDVVFEDNEVRNPRPASSKSWIAYEDHYMSLVRIFRRL